MDIEIKKLNPYDIDDFSELITIFGFVFEMDDLNIPDNKYLKSLLSKPNFLVLIAKYNNKVIGGLTVYVLHSYYSTRPIAYLYDVGVMTDYQRKGIGKQLISYLTQYCKENGFEEAYVEGSR
jgi:aminoglycoside 3-N-acetyltransferase I